MANPDFQFRLPPAFIPLGDEGFQPGDLITPSRQHAGRLRMRRATAADIHGPLYVMERQSAKGGIASCQVRMLLKASDLDCAGQTLWLGADGRPVPSATPPAALSRAVGVVLSDGSFFIDTVAGGVVSAPKPKKSKAKSAKSKA